MVKTVSNDKCRDTFKKIVNEPKYSELNRFTLDRFSNAVCPLCKVKLKFRDIDTLRNHNESKRHQDNLNHEKLQQQIEN